MITLFTWKNDLICIHFNGSFSNFLSWAGQEILFIIYVYYNNYVLDTLKIPDKLMSSLIKRPESFLRLIKKPTNSDLKVIKETSISAFRCIEDTRNSNQRFIRFVKETTVSKDRDLSKRQQWPKSY